MSFFEEVELLAIPATEFFGALMVNLGGGEDDKDAVVESGELKMKLRTTKSEVRHMLGFPFSKLLQSNACDRGDNKSLAIQDGLLHEVLVGVKLGHDAIITRL